MQFYMLQKGFNCSYRGSTSLPTKIIEPSTRYTFNCSKSAIETLEQGVTSLQNYCSKIAKLSEWPEILDNYL